MSVCISRIIILVFLSTTAAHAIDSNSLSLLLTPRQSEVTELVSRGLTNLEIGEILHIKEKTVAQHLRLIFLRNSVSTRRELTFAWIYLKRNPTFVVPDDRSLGRLTLSPREAEVAELVNAGMTNTSIASTLGVSARTIDSHISNILHKNQLKNRKEIALLWATHETE